MAFSNSGDNLEDRRKSIEDRQNDYEAMVVLATTVINLSHIGSAEQRNGRNRAGQFVAQPAAIASQVELEAALLAVSKRVKERETGK